MINLFQVLKNFPGITRKLNCRDMLFTQYECPQLDGKERFFLECNVILYVLRGRRIFHKNNNIWDINEGVCVFVKRGTHISERKDSDEWCVMAFMMPDNFLKQVILEHANNLPMANLPEADVSHVLPLNVNEINKSFFYSMLPYFDQIPPVPEHLLELKFKELILSLLNNKENIRFLSYLYNLSRDRRPSLEDVMQNNFTCNLTLVDYANLSCKSVPTFKREFKKVFHDTPARWVMKKRLALAAELLQNTRRSIGEITFECGFENQTHFSRIFKEKMGLSPLQYRMNHQNVYTAP